jgi:hypothetical protein
MTMAAPWVLMLAVPVLTAPPCGSALDEMAGRLDWACVLFMAMHDKATQAALYRKTPTNPPAVDAIADIGNTAWRLAWPLAALPEELVFSPTATSVPRRSEKMILWQLVFISNNIKKPTLLIFVNLLDFMNLGFLCIYASWRIKSRRVSFLLSLSRKVLKLCDVPR